MIGCRYACEDDIRVLSAAELIWNQPAPLVTVCPSLKRLVGRPACAAASSSATPQASSGGTVRILTGPSRPWWSPGPSLVSSRLINGQQSAAAHPSHPIAA